MESLKLAKGYKVIEEKSTKDLLEDIAIGIAELEKNLRYTLSEQEKIYYRTLSIEQSITEMFKNQQEMRKNIDILIERVK